MVVKLVGFAQNSNFLRKTIYNRGRRRSLGMYKRIESYLNRGDKILDIGAGFCTMTGILLENQFEVTPLDIKNLSFVSGVTSVIYDGRKMPFEDKKFDVLRSRSKGKRVL